MLQIFTLLGALGMFLFIDVVSELEKMGDFMINISQVLYKSR